MVTFSLVANGFAAYARAHRDNPFPAAVAFRAAATVAPWSARFRDMPAIYAIYAETRGFISSHDALTEVSKALDVNKNSLYLALHQTRLREAVQ